jgi:tetratricopeptide (TPR) repeat protein
MPPGSARLPAANDPIRVRARDLLAQAQVEDPNFAPRGELTFTVERELGRGGGGVVHLVTDQRLGRPAALKLLHEPDLARVRRFRREVELTAHLDHPGVPPVYAAGSTTAGQPFLVMRYVRGESLARALRGFHEHDGGGSRSEQKRLLHALVKVAETVAYAHSRGVVHRDLKPGNVMIGDFGEVLVVDWGLARDRRESAQEDAALREALWGKQDARLTQEGTTLGTLGYMAPEQARGEDVGPAADVFALGAMLTEILTGSPPLTGESPDVLIVRTSLGQVEGPREHRSDVARELDSIARRALASDPARRYADAQAFAKDLRAFLDGQRVLAHRYSLVARGRLWARQRPVLAAAVVTVAAVLTGAIPAVYLAAEEAGAAARSGLVAAARGEYETQREVSQAGAVADPVEPALAALSAAQRWYGLDPNDPQAAEARVRAALHLGQVATRTAQWTLAVTAVRSAEGLGWDDEVQATAQAVEAAEENEVRARAENVTRLLAEAEAGVLESRPEGLRTAVYQLARHADPTIVGTLVGRLDEVSMQLDTVLQAAWREAVTPTAEEIELGARPIEGLEDALERLSRRVPGDRRRLVQEEAVTEAAKRILRRARGTGGLVFDPSEARAVVLPLIGARQLEVVGAGALRVAELCVVALGRLQPSAATQDALLRYLRAEADQVRAYPAAQALVRVADEHGLRGLREAIQRFGLNRPFERLVSPLIAQRDESAPRLEGIVELDDVFAHGQVMMDRGDWEGAVRDFTLVLRGDPKNSGAYGNRGLALFELGRVEESLADLARALELSPDDLALFINRAQIYEKVGRVEEAEADLRRALRFDARNGSALNCLGGLLRRTGRMEEALEALDAAVEVDPDMSMGWVNRAEILAQLGRFKEAFADMERAMRLHPGSAKLHATLASIHFNKGDLGAARLEVDRALELDPEQQEALGLQGLVLLSEGRFGDAYRSLSRAIEASDRMGKVAHLANRANCAMQMGRSSLALEDLRSALEIDDSNVQLWWMRALVALSAPLHDEALESAERCIEIAPQVAQGYYVRGNVRLIRDDLQGAREDLAQACQLDPSDGASRMLLGFAVLLSGDEPGAEKLFAAAEASQHYAAIWLTALGGSSRQLEQVAQRRDIAGYLARHYLGRLSAEELLALAEQLPRDRREWALCEVQTHLGLAALGRNQQQAAAERFRIALETDETTSNAYLVSRWLLGKLEGGR